MSNPYRLSNKIKQRQEDPSSTLFYRFIIHWKSSTGFFSLYVFFLPQIAPRLRAPRLCNTSKLSSLHASYMRKVYRPTASSLVIAAFGDGQVKVGMERANPNHIFGIYMGASSLPPPHYHDKFPRIPSAQFKQLNG